MSPTFSVLLPVFNGEEFLAAAIDSVLAQSEKDFELLISDDLSSDNSWEIISKYARADRRIKAWKNSSNLGLFSNYNQCIARASGKFVKTFAQDDLLSSQALERIREVFERFPDVSLIASHRVRIDGLGQQLAPLGIHFDEIFPANEPVQGSKVVLKSLTTATNFIGEPSAVAFRRDSADSGFDTTFYHLGDLEYWLRLVLKSHILFIDEPNCKFRVHRSARSELNKKAMLFTIDLLRLGKKYASFLESAGYPEEAYLRRVVEVLTKLIESQVDSANTSLGEFRLQNKFVTSFYKNASSEVDCERVLGDLLNYRELLFLALSARASAAERSAQTVRSIEVETLASRVIARYDVLESIEREQRWHTLRNQYTVKRLETKLATVLSSFSWRSTRILRDLNRHFGGRRLTGQLEAVRDFERWEKAKDLEYTVNHQLAYISHLQWQLNEVKASRSWKLTRPLRVFSN